MSPNNEAAVVDLMEERFRRLSQRASLAVVARAARRVLPLLIDRDSEVGYYWQAEGAIRLAESLAVGGLVTASDAKEAAKALELDSEEYLWREWTSDRQAHAHVRACAEHVAMAARFAALAVNDDYEFYPTNQGEEVARGVPRAAAVAGLEAVEALRSAPKPDDLPVLLIDRERELLAADSGEAYRGLGQPIDPSPEGPLGPLWPAGTPSWYRLAPYTPRVARGLPPETASPPPYPSDPEMFVASAEAARLALACEDRPRRETTPDLRVTSRRAFLHGSKQQELEVARQAIGERLVRLVSGLATEAALREPPPPPVLILRDRDHFAEPVEHRLAERLGLSLSADAFADFGTTLAGEFFRWLREHPGQRERMRGEFKGERFFVRCPTLRRRPRHG